MHEQTHSRLGKLVTCKHYYIHYVSKWKL